ncbi:MAG TPA: hypothetical protein VN668_05955 [Stellaceae bacterium]|nr:hypothetical protein [Stellaceae bacterium]
MGCGSGGGQSSTVTQTTSPPPQVLAAYQNLLNLGNTVASQPLQQWQGPTIAGFNPTQQAAFSEINQAQGSALPYVNAAQGYLSAGAAPAFPSVMQWNPGNLAQFENPYTAQVTQATQNLLNEQNAEQFNQARGQAASAGAFGGDREAVLESQMAQQQALAEAPTLAGIQSQGFNTAAGLLGQQQNLQLQGMEGDAWRAANAAAMEAGLGNQAQGSLLSGASTELQAGALGQQLQQEEMNVPIGQFLQQQSYPFQTTNFLAGLTEGVGGAMGGNSSTTTPGPSMLGQIGGLGLAGLGAYGQGVQNGWWGGLGGGGASVGMPGGDSTGAMFSGMNFSGFSRRGGRIAFPSIRRDVGGFVPAFDAGFGATDTTLGLSSSDIADIDRAVSLAGASPVTAGSAVLGTPGISIPKPPAPVMGGTTTSTSNPSNSSSGGGGWGGALKGGMSGASAGSMFGPWGAVIGGALGAIIGGTSSSRGGKVPGHVTMGEFLPAHPHASLPRAFADGGGLDDLPPIDTASDVGDYDDGSVFLGDDGGSILPPHPVPGVGVSATGSGFPAASSRAAGFPIWVSVPDRAEPRSGIGSGDLDNFLIRVGAGMMASRSPFFLTQLGQGLQAGLSALPSSRATSPRVDDSGPYLRLLYPGGRSFDTLLPNLNARTSVPRRTLP